MNQRLSNLASIAEIISGIAVVVTLVFLVFGIRENTEIMRAAAYDRNMASLNEWRRGVTQDEQLTRLYGKFVEEDLVGLTTDEQWRLRLVINQLLGIYENSYFARQYGTLGPSEWSRFETQICTLRARMPADMWDAVKPLLTDEFNEYAAALCDDGL